jgi:hypothetical protein
VLIFLFLILDTLLWSIAYLKYNIFLTIDYIEFEPIRDSGNWDKLKSEIRNVVKMSGIDNYVNVYLNFSDEV